MQYVLQFGMILGISFAGEILNALLPLPVPASVYGLCLMLILLCTGILKPDRIRGAATFLTDIMALMFVPAASGLMVRLNDLGTMLVPFLLAGTVGTLLVMVATGHAVQAVIRRTGGKKHD